MKSIIIVVATGIATRRRTKKENGF